MKWIINAMPRANWDGSDATNRIFYFFIRRAPSINAKSEMRHCQMTVSNMEHGKCVCARSCLRARCVFWSKLWPNMLFFSERERPRTILLPPDVDISVNYLLNWVINNYRTNYEGMGCWQREARVKGHTRAWTFQRMIHWAAAFTIARCGRNQWYDQTSIVTLHFNTGHARAHW